MFNRFARAAAAAAILTAAAAGMGMGNQSSASTAGCVSGPATFNWKGTVLPWGVRDYAVTYCGTGDVEMYAGLRWKGAGKSVAMVLIAPDGSQRMFTGTTEATTEFGPVGTGTWTLLVRNLGSSNVNYTAAIDLSPP